MNKQLIYALSLSALLFACSSDPDDGQQGKTPISACKQVAAATSIIPDNLDPACKNEQRKLVVISEMHWEETDWDYLGGEHSASYVNGEYFLNGEKISVEEYNAFMEDYNKKYAEQQKGKRDLPIQCLVSDDAVTWTALLTNEEIEELKKTYGELSIQDYVEPKSNESAEESGGGC